MSSDTERNFIDLLPDFYQYMTTFGKIAPKTAKDYITRLKNLTERHVIDSSLTQEKINRVLLLENEERLHRDKYRTKESIRDFRAGLNKFLDFINFDYGKAVDSQNLTEIKSVEKASDLSVTEKETINKARIGQGNFRDALIKQWGGCSISGCKMKNILIASHIKPWRVSDNKERLDKYNGLLLLPNYDKLFDKGYITINLDGRIKISGYISDENMKLLNLNELPVIPINYQHKEYLKYHNEFLFLGG